MDARFKACIFEVVEGVVDNVECVVVVIIGGGGEERDGGSGNRRKRWL